METTYLKRACRPVEGPPAKSCTASRPRCTFCRSITGDGVRGTLARIAERIPLELHEVPSGTKVFDWTVPPEWNVRDAYVKNAAGERVVDFRESEPPRRGLQRAGAREGLLAELKEHLFTLPEHPDWIPYRTSYYRRNWGFCMSHARFLELDEEVNTRSASTPRWTRAPSPTESVSSGAGAPGDRLLVPCLPPVPL
ncbi:MAG: DUF2172 domain-containing protein [Thermodesulfovibrionales bacterium]